MAQKGRIVTAETRLKLSRAGKGRIVTAETRAKISKASKNPSEETRRKISVALMNRIPWNKGLKTGPRSEETRRKISKSHKGRVMPEETKLKISKANKGRVSHRKGKHLTESHRRNVSVALTGKRLSDETKQKLREANLGKRHSEKTKKLMSIKAKQNIINRPENSIMKDTKPEIAMKKLLDSLDIPYIHQYRTKLYLYDFLLRSTNILIEVDGDYWHGNPKRFQNLNKVQLKIKERDKEKDEWAIHNDFKLIRFWESDILKFPEKVTSKLTDMMTIY